MAPSHHMGPRRSYEPTSKRKWPDNLKFTFIGASGVGKNSLVEQFVHPSNELPVYDPTSGWASDSNITVDGHSVLVETVKQDIGSEWILNMVDQAVKVGSGLVLVYDTTSEASFLDLKQWLARYRDHRVSQRHKRDVSFIMLIGNKSDRDEERQVTWEQGRLLARKLRAEFVETSAGDSKAVKQLFHDLVRVTRSRPWPPRNADFKPSRMAEPKTSMSSTRSAPQREPNESFFSAFRRKMSLGDEKRPRAVLTKRRPSSSWEKPPLKRSDLQLDVDLGGQFDFEGEAQQKLDLTLERLRRR